MATDAPANAAETATPAPTSTDADVSLLDDAIAAAPEKDAGDKPDTKSKPADDKPAGDDGEKTKSQDDVDLLADDDKGTPEKKADGQADADKAPEAYEAFTLPDGMALDDATLAIATPVFRDAGLDQAKAQKLVDVYVQLQQAAAEQQTANFLKVKSDWVAEIKADPEFGNERLPQTLGAAKAIIAKFGDKELLSDLREWGWSNHPGLLRMLAKINARLSPDTLVTADAAAQPQAQKPWDVLWPDMNKPQE